MCIRDRCTDTDKEDEKKVSEGFIITDQAGRKVNFDKPAEKAISGYYIATSTVIGLGQKDKLIDVYKRQKYNSFPHL